MKRALTLLSVVTIVLLALAALPAFAQNEAVMNVHLNTATAIPGKVLQAGDYVFRLHDSVSRPNEVEVMTADGKTIYGFIPVYEASRNSGTSSQIETTPLDASGLARIDSWYFPGQHDGYRFIYSNADLRKIDTIARQMKPADASVGMQ